jgi:predicted N-formylglutamate amidohydrolase
MGDWHTFAEIYNGPAQDAPAGVVHDYDFRIAQEFDRLEAGA